jgi:hypothetical protein
MMYVDQEYVLFCEFDLLKKLFWLKFSRA